MTDRLYSVEQVAELLGLHVRTVRSYVRDGKLPAARIGKQYRITHEDLETFTGLPISTPQTVSRRHAESSCIVEIDDIDRATVDRITTLLTTTAGTRGGRGQRMRVETSYDPARRRLKVILLGSLADSSRLLDYLDGILRS
ncbi:helix-turn-helix domain-containing protein [Nocardia sp. NPDC060249]|uniref:helix-turn-helix domain-containing protein n=1 Tax=Nocardia sp. NPDC060249 TaxID=3347082 RepID=UPI0036636ACA